MRRSFTAAARLISRRFNYLLLLVSLVVTTDTFHLLFGPFHLAAPLPTPSSPSVWSAPYVWTPAAIPLFNIPLFATLAVPPPPARQQSVINIFVITQGRVTSATTTRFLTLCDRLRIGPLPRIPEEPPDLPLGKDVPSLCAVCTRKLKL